MPPHCDSLDGPVVAAARRALEKGDVNLILPYVKEGATPDMRSAFDMAVRARKLDSSAREVADLYFYETAVRLHRAGEGAPYTGLKPAGLDVGPVIPVAEKAIEAGSPDPLIALLTETLRHELQHRFERIMELRDYPSTDVARGREYVEAALGLQVYSHKLYEAMKAHPHEAEGAESLPQHHH